MPLSIPPYDNENLDKRVQPYARSARSPQQQPCSVFRMVTVKETMESAEKKIPLDVCVCMEERAEGKIKPEWRAIKSQRADTDPKAPGQQHLSSWEIRRTTADDCSLADESLDLGGPPPFKPLLSG